MSREGDGKGHLLVGPWGGETGARWDDGVHSAVRQLVINHGGGGIDSIQIEYDKRGSSVWSEKHGGSGGLRTDKVKLDYPDEFIISMSGHYGSIDKGGSNVVVRSLTFETNKGKKRYGPFGIQHGTPFSVFPMGGGKVVGFHGRSSWHLTSIGVHLKPLLHRHVSHNTPKTAKGCDTNLSIYKEAMNNRVEVGANEKVTYDISQKTHEGYTNIGKTTSLGPWGGNGGILFDDGLYTGVRAIHLTHYGGIISIRICYDLNGQAVWANKNGGTGGIQLEKVVLDYPSEFLTHVTGYYGPTIFMGPTVVKSLTFHTNKRRYGPFGEDLGIAFSSVAADESKGEGGSKMRIVGFHGRKGWFVDSIGVHVIHGETPHLPRGRPHHEPSPMKDLRTPKVTPPTMVMMKEEGGVGSGPWGGEGGEAWDDGVFSGVKQIFLTGADSICSIQIEYDRNGQSVWSVQHGSGAGTGPGQRNTHWVKFQYPHEVLTCVSGYYGSVSGGGCGGEEGRTATKVIKSLTFYSNRGKYGPYGEELGRFFSSTRTEEGKIVGFHGRCGPHLTAIGVHMQHWLDEVGDHNRHRATAAVAQQWLAAPKKPIKTILHKIFTS